MAIVRLNLQSEPEAFMALFFWDTGKLHLITEIGGPDITADTVLTYDDSIYRKKSGGSAEEILQGEVEEPDWSETIQVSTLHGSRELKPIISSR